MRKTAFTLLVILLLLMLQIIETVNANPIAPNNTDSYEKPSIVIKSPVNNEALNSTNNLYLNFAVNYPPSWEKIKIDNYFWAQIDSLDVNIDGILNNRFINNYTCTDSNYNFTDFSINLNCLGAGSHLANVTVYSHSYSLGVNNYPFPQLNTSIGMLYGFPIVVSDSINFSIVEHVQPSPSTIPSTSSPRTNETPIASYQYNPIALTAIASMIVIVAVISVSLVYHKRRKKSK
jgi:hypothetical protein